MDGIGTTKYSYAMLGNGLSTMTEDGPWASDDITVTNRGGLRGGLKITQPTAQYVVTNQYDGARRLTTVGGTAGTFNYFYSTALPSGLPLGIALPGGPSITNRYDSLARLTSTELRTNTLLNLHGYQYNNAFQRTWISRTNSAATAWNGYQDLAYDAAGELTKSWAYTNGTAMLSEKWTYGYDPAQNLLKRTNNTTVETFAANALNQLSAIPNSTPTYDRRGNLTARTFSGGVIWGYYYDHENRLTNVIDYYNPTLANRFKVDFTYDGQGRLRTMKPYTWMDGWGWYEGTERRYVYDGMQIVQERSGNVPSVTYTRGRDLSGSLSGAGGIGGLLARSSGYSSGTGAWSTHDFYHADGNPDLRYGTSTSTTSASVGVSITAMVNASGTLRAYYRYDPFGRQRAQGGALATANVMRFSSKPWVAFNANISDGLYYYGYRFYDPYLQRWVNRDPLGDLGHAVRPRYGSHTPASLLRLAELVEAPNLYTFVRNTPVRSIDRDGRMLVDGDSGHPNPVPSPKAPPEWHKCRNQNQTCPENEPVGDPDWKRDKFNWGNTDPMKGHVGNCYRGPKGGPIAGLGGAQCCYVNGKLNHDDEGTYDYIQPGDSYWDPGTWGHIGVDVLPALIWGN